MAELQISAGGALKDMRGRGLMIAVEMQPDAGGAGPVCEALRRRGLLAKETHETTIRIAPPLIISESEADWIADQFAAVLV